MRIVMIIASVGSYLINEAVTKGSLRHREGDELRAPLTQLGG